MMIDRRIFLLFATGESESGTLSEITRLATRKGAPYLGKGYAWTYMDRLCHAGLVLRTRQLLSDGKVDEARYTLTTKGKDARDELCRAMDCLRGRNAPMPKRSA